MVSISADTPNIRNRHKQFISSCPADALQVIDEAKTVLNSMEINPTTCALSSSRSLKYDYNVLYNYANRGSKTAKKLCDALIHFQNAMEIFMESGTLTEEQENIFVHELSQCFRIEHIVAEIPGLKTRQKIVEIVYRVLCRCNTQSVTTNSQLDEDVRVCYADMNFDSHGLTLQFLNICKQKYPKSVYFLYLSASANGFLKKFEAALYDTNAALEIDPNNYELLYYRAVALRLMEKDMNEAIEAYRTFLKVAPKDHRFIPESYYEMATCYIKRHMSDDDIDNIKKIYRTGEEAEKLQLPCFLPYQSNSKTMLKLIVDKESLRNTKPASDNKFKLRLTDPHRVEIITHHRKWESDLLQAKNNPNMRIIPTTREPRVKQKTAKSLIGLKPITLRELNPAKDHVYKGHVLTVTIIEEGYSWIPSIHLIIEDENLDCHRLYIYGFPGEQGEYLTSKMYTNGSKMHIINPYLRIGAKDLKPSIRVDDFSSIMMQNESERIINMCRCCGKVNAPHACSKCEQAYYCAKECQIMDWKLYKHKLLCIVK